MFGQKKESPKGMAIIASAGNASQSDKLLKSHKNIEIIEASSKIRKYKCGHEGPKIYKLDVYGQVTEKIKKKDICAKCRLEKYKKYVIPCTSCGLPIHPGDAVALYANNKELFDQSLITFVNNGVLGCMRWYCCPSGGFFAGHWSEDGFKSAFDKDNTIAEQCYEDNFPS